jgi:hypothetical protein
MRYDHHAAARTLTVRLDAEGQGAWAEKLRRVLEEGATGTEIFMGLRWQLQQLAGSGDSLSEGTRAQLETLLKELNTALR